MSTTEKISALITDLAEINNGINTEAEIITEIQSVIDNMPTVVGGSYDKGYADGKQAEYDRLVDETKIIEKTIRGSLICVDDVSEIPHKCMVAASRKNLLRSKQYAAGNNGVTFTNNANGTVTVSGTSSTTYIHDMGSKNKSYLPAGQYVFSCGYSVAGASGIEFQLGADDANGSYHSICNQIGSMGNSSIAFTLSEPTEVYTRILLNSGRQVDGTFALQIEAGTVATEYEPYYENTTVTVCGKNLMDKVDFNKAYWVEDNGTFTSTNTAATYVYRELYLHLGVTYTFSCYLKPTNGGTFALTVRDAEKRTLVADYKSAEGVYSLTYTPSESGIYRFTVGGTNNDNGVTISQLQIEVGTTATDYEPYCVETHALTAGQTVEIDNICPTMTLLTDNNATITLGYHKSWGMQTEYDRFWDVYQNYGKREVYSHAFRGDAFNDQIFKPKYDIVPTEADFMFGYSGYDANNTGKPYLTDVKGLLEQVGVVLDTSKCVKMEYFAYLAQSITRLPTVSHEGVTKLQGTFRSCENLKSIDELVLRDNGTNTFGTGTSAPFFMCSKLSHMIVKGTIGQNNFNVSWCPLDHESLMSIINALQNHTNIYTKTDNVIQINNEKIENGYAGFLESVTNKCYTTTGEKVRLYWYYDDNGLNMYDHFVCEKDGVYYEVIESENTIAHELVLGSTNVAKLADYEKLIATNKGWSLST